MIRDFMTRPRQFRLRYMIGCLTALVLLRSCARHNQQRRWEEFRSRHPHASHVAANLAG